MSHKREKLTDRHRAVIHRLHEIGELHLPEHVHKFRRGEELNDEEHTTVERFFAGLRLPDGIK